MGEKEIFIGKCCEERRRRITDGKSKQYQEDIYRLFMNLWRNARKHFKKMGKRQENEAESYGLVRISNKMHVVGEDLR